MKSICVYCGSSMSNDPRFVDTAYSLGKMLAENNIRLVYGGAKVGLMGQVARGCLENSGEVYGVIPTFLAGKEIVHDGLTKLFECTSMHERKTKMFELSEGFIALPGGFGTLEELAEILTWQQLGLHSHPVGVLNINGYYDHLEMLVDTMYKKELISESHVKMAIFDNDISALIQGMKDYTAPEVPVFLSKERT